MTTVVPAGLKIYDNDNNHSQSEELISWWAWFSTANPKATETG